ncbi:hypothetical protein NL676_023737 [Syzygium grande]|nr:hypothetical protein NL676_023737 [Syzygium grande]
MEAGGEGRDCLNNSNCNRRGSWERRRQWGILYIRHTLNGHTRRKRTFRFVVGVMMPLAGIPPVGRVVASDLEGRPPSLTSRGGAECRAGKLSRFASALSYRAQ